MEKFIFPTLLVILMVCPYLVTTQLYFDINSYMKFPQGMNLLIGGDIRLSFSFRYCNPKGILLYQNSPTSGYFAMGISNRKIYIEWKMSNIIVELYIGNGDLEPNRTYAVNIYNLNDRLQTSANINGAPVMVEYLIVLNERLNLDNQLAEVYIGGFMDISLLPVNTERISAYLIMCLDYLETPYRRIDLSLNQSGILYNGVYPGCPPDFCAAPTLMTANSTTSFALMNVTVKARTRTQISFRFRTRAPRGMLFYLGNRNVSSYLTLFLNDGGILGLGLNTKAQDAGSFSYSSLSGYNDGQWKYVQVIRTDNVARVYNEQGNLVVSTTFGMSNESGFNLNADTLLMAGSSISLSFLPSSAQVSLPGCFEAPRFVSYSIAPEPASLLSFDNGISQSNNVILRNCYPSLVCSPACTNPSQYCDLTCLCSPGYQAVNLNPLTCTNINDCLPNPCQNGATCVDLVQDYTCICPPGYGGKNCSQISYCSSAPCRNGATCIDTSTGFACTCVQGYAGLICDTDINECASNPCPNGATCQNLIGRYQCTCPPGYYGNNCEFDINECQAIPCLNQATCINTIGSFYCVCASGYSGTRCEININECSSNPCLNNGACVDAVNRYFCNCQPGFIGDRCETNVNECASNPCQNGGICTDGINLYTCSCVPGYTGVNCELDINECASNPCRNGGVCQNLLNRYQCQCQTGYTGVTCETTISYCLSNPCRNNGVCVDRVGFFQCICYPGWTGTLCDTDIDDCLSNPCLNGASCVNEIGLYRCVCLPGYAGTNCQTNINECASNPCLNGGTCTDLVNGYFCTCLPQYVGTNCAGEYNVCASNPCRNGATCNNLIGRFTCTCLPGYTDIFCQVDINECASFPCLNNGVCIDRINSFFCQCPAGFIGTRCEINYNECSSNPCVNGVCVDGINSFTCTCFSGWQGIRCETDINECASNPCQNGATCENLQNRYRCICLPGYEGTNCETNANDCYFPTLHKCANGATCVDGIGTYTCLCTPGWTGQFCDQDLNECNSNPCLNNGQCTNLQNAFYCTCQPGFTGPTCGVDIDECASGVCRNAISCVNTYGSYTCFCQPGYTGKNCDSQTNPCATYMCYFGGTCEVVNNTSHCLCLSDYMGNQCDAVIRHCEYSHPCKNNAFCQNKQLGGYQCFCIPGFSGPECADNINECASNPCYNGGTCIDQINGYICNCLPGYTGQMCIIDIDECASQPCQNGGTCTQPAINMYRCTCPLGYTGTNCEQIINNCASNPCQSWQICTNAVNNFTCSCPTGFTGDRCTERIDKCFSQPCMNGGTCSMLPSGSFSCLCPFPFAGTRCDVTTDACYPNPCLHFGTCFRDATRIQGYYCLCQPGFIGERCQGDLYTCFSNPCKNGANCWQWFNGTNGYSCNCSSSFIGPFCDIPVSSFCSSFPCLNGGSCSQTSTGYSCTCPSSWSGSRCDQDVNECAISTPCLNGGTCFNTVGSFYCTCTSSWSGATCNVPSSGPCSSNSCPGQTCVPFDNGTFICCIPGTNCPNPCSPNPCVTGTCQIVSMTQFACICPSGITGTRCERALFVTFGGNGFLDIPLSSPSRKKRQIASNETIIRSIQFTIKTTRGRGVIVYIDEARNTGPQPGYLLVELYNNAIRFAAGFPQDEIIREIGIYTILSYAASINVSINISINSITFSLSICDSPPCQRIVNITDGTFLYNLQYFRIGWKQTWTPFQRSRVRSNETFIGCLGNLYANDQPLSLLWENITIPSTNTTGTGPIPGCDDHALCSSSYCTGRGTCVDDWLTKRCLCDPSFQSERCQRQTMVNFPGSVTVVTFDFGITMHSFSVSFSMTANNAGGLVLYTVTETPFALYMDSWRLILVVLINPESNITFSNMDMSDGGWYNVNIIMSQTSISVTVVSVATNIQISNSLPYPAGNPNVTGRLYFGSPNNNVWLRFSTSFTGCIRGLTINSVPNYWVVNPSLQNITSSCPRENKCQNSPCMNGGNCISSWTSFTCQCLPAFTGPFCSSDLEVSYGNQISYTDITVDASRYPFGRIISLSVKTVKENTPCLMYIEFSSSQSSAVTAYICLMIYNGSLSLWAKNDTEVIALQSSTNLKVNVGYWTEIAMSPFGSSYNLRVNTTSQQLQTNTPMFSSSRSSTVKVYLGNRRAITDPLFSGCISRVKLNEDNIVSLINSNVPPIQSLESGNISRSCQLLDCNSGVCSGQGRCISFWGQTQCLCNQGYNGTTCEQSIFIDPCSTSPCQNGGTCTRIDNINYICTCLPSWAGLQCQNQSLCSIGCLNGGVCLIQNSVPYCSCSAGFTGDQCQFCTYCLNGGVCARVGDTSTCNCSAGFTGNQCQFCTYCLNGGGCVRVGDRLTCNCSAGFTGDQCQFCTYCLNGGVCARVGDTSTCSCSAGFTGDQCQFCTYCLNGGGCVRVGDTSTCNCSAGFTGNQCQFCTYCLNGGVCARVGDRLTCNCSAAFTGDQCNFPNPCASNPCPSNSTCAPVNGTNFTCTSQSSQTSNPLRAPDAGLAIGLGVGIPLFLLAALGAYLIYQREQKLRGNYKPQESEQNIRLQSSNTRRGPFTIFK